MSRREKMVVGQRDESKTQCIQRLRDSMPNPWCEPVPTVLDTRGNAMSSKSHRARQVLGEQWKASFPRKRRVLLDVSPPRWVTKHAPCPNTCYFAYFPNDIFRDAVKRYLINVYGREQHHERTVAPAGFTLLTPATDDNAETSETDSSWTIIGDVTRQA